MGRRLRPILWLSLLAGLAAASALPDRGTLRTSDGRAYEGRLELADGDALVIVPRGAEPVVVPLGQLKAALFQAAPAADLQVNRRNDETPPHDDPKEAEPPTGVMLRDASLVFGTIRSIDETGVTLVREGKARRFEPEAIARVVFSRTLPEGADAAARGHAGAILETGDFFEGELRSFAGGRVTISSVLFGNRTFTAGKELLALVYTDAKPLDVKFIVRTADGSTVRAKSLRVSKKAATVEDGTGVRWQFGADEIVSIEGGE